MIPFTNIPFFSAFFLVLVGVLIGNLIWHRFRDEQEQSQYQLRVKNRRLTSAIENQSADIERVESEWVQATEELSNLRASVQELEHEQKQWLQERERTAVQLAQERQARQDLEACLRDEQEKLTVTVENRDDLVDRLSRIEDERGNLQLQVDQTNHQLLEMNLRTEERMVERRELEQRLEETFARQESQAQSLKQAEDELEQTRNSLAAQQTLNEQQQAKLQQMEVQQATAEVSHNTTDEELRQLKLTYTRLSESHDQANHALTMSEDALARSMDEVVALRTQLVSFETRHDELVGESEASASRESELNSQLADLEAHRARIQQQLVAAEDHVRRLEGELRVERDRHLSLQHAHTQLQNDYDASQQNLQEVEHRCSLVLVEAGASEQASQQRLVDVETQHGLLLMLIWRETHHRLSQAIAKANKLQVDFDRVDRERLAVSQQRDHREEELNRLEKIEEQFLQRGVELQQSKRDAKDAQHQLEQAMQAETATKEVVGSLRDELTECLVDVERLRDEITVRDEALRGERRRREALETAADSAALSQQELNETLLMAQRTEACLTARLIDRGAEVHQLERSLAGWLARCNEYQSRSEHAESRLDELTRELDRQKQLSDQMRRRRFGSLDQQAATEDVAPLSFREMRSKELMRRLQDEQNLRNDAEMGSVFDEPPQRPDDLTKIPAIHEGLQQALNELGIYTYRQIMAWDARAMQVVGDRLQIGNDIRRNDWIGHARRLYHDDQRSIA